MRQRYQLVMTENTHLHSLERNIKKFNDTKLQNKIMRIENDNNFQSIN